MQVQRRPGSQDRVDLAYAWPSLAPLAQAPERGPTPLGPSDRLFLTIADSGGAAEPAQRFRTIYLRYAESERAPAPDGLVVRAFRAGAPYDGEDLAYDESAPERFVARCARSSSPVAPASCLHERYVGAASVTVRFARDRLSDWRAIAAGIDRLVAGLRPETGE